MRGVGDGAAITGCRVARLVTHSHILPFDCLHCAQVLDRPLVAASENYRPCFNRKRNGESVRNIWIGLISGTSIFFLGGGDIFVQRWILRHNIPSEHNNWNNAN